MGEQGTESDLCGAEGGGGCAGQGGQGGAYELAGVGFLHQHGDAAGADEGRGCPVLLTAQSLPQKQHMRDLDVLKAKGHSQLRDSCLVCLDVKPSVETCAVPPSLRHLLPQMSQAHQSIPPDKSSGIGPCTERSQTTGAAHSGGGDGQGVQYGTQGPVQSFSIERHGSRG